MNIKLTTRLAISVASFLLPLGILLFSVVSISFTSIRKDTRELDGIEVLRPAITLMQTVPLYIHYTLDGAGGDTEAVKRQTTDLLNELNEKYLKHFGTTNVISMQTLLQNWDRLTSTAIRDTIHFTYREIMQDLTKLISYIGDISGLITDSEIENTYIVTAAIHEIPLVQERIVVTGNMIRLIEAGAFTQRRKEELEINLQLLVHSDNARIQKRYNDVETLGLINKVNMGNFEILLKNCIDRITYFSNAVEYTINLPEISLEAVKTLYENAIEANNSAFRLQLTSFDMLESLLNERIQRNRQRFIISIAASLAATFLAFSIIISTLKYIGKSTKMIASTFKRLDNNDLTVQLKAVSKDEMGELIKVLGRFLDKLNLDFLSFIDSASMVTTAVNDLSTSAQQISTTANEQSASVAEIVSTMESNKDLSAQASEKTYEVARLASETQELSLRGASLRDVNEDMMLDILNQNSKIIEIIRNLADMLSRIDESIQLIDTIADRTKLIAFNAALEASSSGEAGSRFSVVAGEIRRFADNVVESVTEIKEKIAELQQASDTLITEANNGTKAIDAGYTRMVEQKEIFENIVNVSKNVASRSQQISGLSRQQEMASMQVFSALKEISSGVSQFVSSTAQTTLTIEKLNSMATELKNTLNRYQTREKE